MNQTSQPFHVECNKIANILVESEDRSAFFGSSSFLTIEQNSVRRVMIALHRMFVPPNDMPFLDAAMKKFLIKEKHLTEAQFDLFRALQVYRIKLMEQFDIRFHSITENTHGKLRLDSFTLTEAQLVHLKRSNLQINLVPVGIENTCLIPMHHLLHLGVNIKQNIPEEASNDLRVSLVPQRFLNNSSFSWVNRLYDVELNKVQGDSVFVVCFHEQGDYQLLVYCKDVMKDKEYWSPPLEVHVK